MEQLKKYLPYIIVALVGLYLIRKLGSQSTALVPQTQLIETPQVDPFAESRASAFGGLLQLTGLQIGEEAETERAEIAGRVAIRAQGLAARAQDVQRELGLRALDVDLGKADLFAEASRLAAENNFLARENDRQVQQSAVDRFYSSRRTSDIVGSVSQALEIIFGNRSNRGGGSVFGTPPTFPSGGGFGGGFGGSF